MTTDASKSAPSPSLWASLRSLTAEQRNAFIAAFLGWTLDAFDFFILVMALGDVAREFHVKTSAVALALTLTLALRPLGALLFGIAADRYGRRIPLMVDVILFSLLELLSGFAPTLTIFLILRALFGIAMGGEWGLGASLALESAPPQVRGLLSGILQEGYSAGYLLAALAYGVIFPLWGWRALFYVGALPALLSLFIRAQVKESPVWEASHATRNKAAQDSGNLWDSIRKHAGLFVYLIVLMTAFTFMSHGTQDLYPTFMKEQLKFSPRVASTIAIVYNVGALCGGVFFGWFSQRAGRRRAIVIAALLALPIIPLWAYARTPVLLALGAFLMQFMVQGAWGVIPAHLTELSPNALRGTFTGFAYQLGNLVSSSNSTIQSNLAERYGGDYARALSRTIGLVLVAVAVVTAFGHEAKGVEFIQESKTEGAPESGEKDEARKDL